MKIRYLKKKCRFIQSFSLVHREVDYVKVHAVSSFQFNCNQAQPSATQFQIIQFPSETHSSLDVEIVSIEMQMKLRSEIRK